jgi:NRPS condensation-like uncharacterized protein
LREKVNPAVLKTALCEILPKYPSFNVQMKRGIFWHFFEENRKPLKVFAEKDVQTDKIDFRANNYYLFRTTYHNNIISLDFFHSVADGKGGIEFSKAVVLRYLEILGYDVKGEGIIRPFDAPSPWGEIEDSFLNSYKRMSLKDINVKEIVGRKGYSINGLEIDGGRIGIINGVCSVEAVKAAAKSYGATVTEYLGGLFIYSVYKTNYNDHNGKKPIKLMIPIDLRRFFPSKTLRNFTTAAIIEVDTDIKKHAEKQKSGGINANAEKEKINEINSNADIEKYAKAEKQRSGGINANTEKEKIDEINSNADIEKYAETEKQKSGGINANAEKEKSGEMNSNADIKKYAEAKEDTLGYFISQVGEQLKKSLREDEIHAKVAGVVKLDKNILVKLVPLPLKYIVIKTVQNVMEWLNSANSTSVLTNPGVVDMPESMKPHIKHMSMILVPVKDTKLNCAVLTYNGEISITFSRRYKDVGLIKFFFDTLINAGAELSVASNYAEMDLTEI